MFSLDKYYLITNKEKTLVNRVKVSDSEFIEARLTFESEYERRDGWNRPTGLLLPVVVVSKWTQSGEFFTSYGLDVRRKLGPAVKRRSLKLLEEYGARLTDSDILAIANNDAAKLNDPFVC